MRRSQIGIITMHRVQNFGSVLQAFALQEKILSYGYSVEIIDYDYPNAEHLRSQGKIPLNFRQACLRQIKMLLFKVCHFFTPSVVERKYPYLSKDLKFERFINSYLYLSKRRYRTMESIKKDVPVYEEYMTGSDQVWNARFAAGDLNFFCAFAPSGAPRYSYASSFANDGMPTSYAKEITSELSKYSAISIREELNVETVAALAHKKVDVVCDPTLLLTPDEWLARIPRPGGLRLPEKYLLLYILDYAYDPYPAIMNIILEVQKRLKLQVVVLNGLKQDCFIQGALTLKDCGPMEFVHCIAGASFILTTSFHGTAFALNFSKPFYAVVSRQNSSDARIYDLLKHCHALDRAVYVEDGLKTDVPCGEYVKELSLYRQKSENFLKNCLI